MCTISHEQETGSAAKLPASPSPSPSPGAREGQKLPHPSLRSDKGGSAEGTSKIVEIMGSNVSNSSQLKSDVGDAAGKGSQRDQAQTCGVISAVSCETSTLFVGGLHPRIGDLHLQKLFTPYGVIVRSNIVSQNPSDLKHNNAAKYTTGLQQSKGFAFVEYTSIESARLAISRLNGRQLMGRTLAVRPSRKRTSDFVRGGIGGGEAGKSGPKVSVEEARREYSAVQCKIEAVKRAIEQKQKGM